jgi:hypothetical protein
VAEPERAADVVRRLVALSRIPMLASVPAEVLARLVQSAEETTVREGALLPPAAGTVRFLPNGGAEVGAPPRNGVARHVPELVPWLAGSEATADLAAIEPGAAIAIPRELLGVALGKDLALFRAVAAALASSIIEAQQHPRVAQALLVAMERPLRDQDARVDLAGRVMILRAVVPFSRAYVGSLFQLARQAAEIRADHGLEIWRRGDASEHALVVMSGSVRLRTSGRIDLQAGPGTVLGAFDALAGQPRWYTAVAERPVVALSVSIESLIDVLEDEPVLSREVLAALARALQLCWREAGR